MKDSLGKCFEPINAAYNENDYEKALEKLKQACEWLERVNPSAADSLREGMEETLTVVKLGVPEELRKTVSSTNPIESALSTARRITRRVRGYRQIHLLVSATTDRTWTQ